MPRGRAWAAYKVPENFRRSFQDPPLSQAFTHLYSITALKLGDLVELQEMGDLWTEELFSSGRKLA
jgi:hypothetical protein